MLLILSPLLTIDLLASLFDEKILFFDKNSKKLIPLLNSLDFNCISGRPKPNPPFSNVSPKQFLHEEF